MARAKKMTPEKTEQALKMLEAGVRRKEIIDALGVSYLQLAKACGPAWRQKGGASTVEQQ